MRWTFKSGRQADAERRAERIKSLVANNGIQLAGINALNRASFGWINDHALLSDCIRNRIRQADIMLGRIFGKR